LLELETVRIDWKTEKIQINLFWPEKMKREEFEEKFNLLPRAQSYRVLQGKD